MSSIRQSSLLAASSPLHSTIAGSPCPGHSSSTSRSGIRRCVTIRAPERYDTFSSELATTPSNPDSARMSSKRSVSMRRRSPEDTAQPTRNSQEGVAGQVMETVQTP